MEDIKLEIKCFNPDHSLKDNISTHAQNPSDIYLNMGERKNTLKEMDAIGDHSTPTPSVSMKIEFYKNPHRP